MAYQSAHTGQEIDSAVSGVITAMGENFSDPLAAQSDITEVESDITGLRSQLNAVRSDITEVESDIAGLQSDITKAKSDIVDLQSDITKAKSDIVDLQNRFNQARPIARTLSWSGSTGNYTATITISSAMSTSVDPMVWIMGTDYNRYYCDYSVTKSGTTYTITIRSNHDLSGTAYIYGIVAPR